MTTTLNTSCSEYIMFCEQSEGFCMHEFCSNNNLLNKNRPPSIVQVLAHATKYLR